MIPKRRAFAPVPPTVSNAVHLMVHKQLPNGLDRCMRGAENIQLVCHNLEFGNPTVSCVFVLDKLHGEELYSERLVLKH